jgi:O-antigen/teichoic acid export membrane protein
MSNSTNSRKQIKLGAAISYMSILFNILAGLIYTPWMILKIGQSEYGLYMLALSVISFFTMDFGLGAAVARFMSRYNVEGNKDKVSDFLGITFKLYVVIDILIFVVLLGLFLFIDNIYAELTPVELYQFKIVFCIASLYSIASFPFIPLNGILISNERFIFLKSADIIHKVFTVATMVVVLILGYRLYALIIVNAITGLLIIAFKLSYILKNNLISVNFKVRDNKMIRSIFNYSFWTTIIVTSQRFILNITPTILGAFAGSVQISLFAIAIAIEGYIWTYANALNGLFLPKVTRMTISSNNPTEVEDLMIKVGRIQLVMTGILMVGFLTMGKEFMVLWLGDSFKESYYITMFLIGTGIITLTQQIGNTVLIALNEIKYRAFCNVTAAGISFSLSIVLSQIYGALGSGIAIFIGSLIGNVIGMNIVYNKVLEINIFRFFKECHVKMITPLLLTCVIGLLIQYRFPVETLLLFMGKAGLLAVIYLVLMWTISFNRYEKDLFFELIRGTSNRILNRR